MSARNGWSRREFLTGAGVAIGLPFFQSLWPHTAWADGVKAPQRLLFLSVPLGFVPPNAFQNSGNEGWFPKTDGPDYKMPDVHAALQPYRQHISFLKNLWHHLFRDDPHYADDVWLTGADTYADPSRAFVNTISCDQVAASYQEMNGGVRYSSLALGIDPKRAQYGTHSGGLSWTPQGVPIAPITSPARTFDLLFGKDDMPAALRLLRLKEKRSVLDSTLGQIKGLNQKLNANDRRKLDEVVSAVRGVEQTIQREEHWVNIPKPKIAFDRPPDEISTSTTKHAQTMFDLIHAAFLTDSTRVITYEMPDIFNDTMPNDSKHGLTHPQEMDTHRRAIRCDQEMSNQLAHYMQLMCAKSGDEAPLIENSLTAYGSAAWGNNHTVKNLPVMLLGHAGGKIKTGFSRSYPETVPLTNVWLTMLKACGLPATSFSDSSGVLDDLLA